MADLPSIIYKINERSYYEKFAKQLIKHLSGNLETVATGLKYNEINIVKKSLKYRLYFDGNRRVNRIVLEHNLVGLMIDLGVAKGVKLEDVGYQKIGRTLLGRKVKKRRAGRWYLKTIYGQTIRLMEIVAKQRGDEYTVIVQKGLEQVSKININI